MREPTMILLCAAAAWLAGCGAGNQSSSAGPHGAEPAVNAAEPGGAPTSGACDAIETRAAEVWNPEIRAAVDFSVKIYAGEITAADAEWLATRMDRFTLAWIRLGRTSCAAHFEEGTLTAGDYAARRACFDASLERQRRVVSTLESSGRDAGNDMDELFAELARCVPDQASPELEIRSNPFKRGGR